MKLFVWEGVLEDYTLGMVCALAKNEKQAWEMLYKKDDLFWWVLQGKPRYPGERKYAILAYEHRPKCGYFPSATRPRIVTEPETFMVWGGG